MYINTCHVRGPEYRDGAHGTQLCIYTYTCIYNTGRHTRYRQRHISYRFPTVLATAPAANIVPVPVGPQINLNTHIYTHTYIYVD